MRTNVIPTDGMIITEDTQLAPGIYILPRGLVIGADGVTLSGTETTLRGASQEGIGVQVAGHNGVIIRGLSLSSYHYGIRADDCQNVTIEDVTIRDTAEIRGIDTFLYLWPPIEDAYGGAILLHHVHNGIVRGCDLQHQMHGIQLYGSSGLTIERNNASFNSGWGVYLSGATDNVIQDNQLDFCNRVYRRPEDGSIRVEADAAAIVLVRSASRNKFLRNSCLCGGDGIFVAGYFHPGGITPCNDNLFEDNDCRLSPNSAIESTFSRGNVFRRNNCSRSNYGLWMGFSWENTLEHNIVEYNRFVGIAIEHGHTMALLENRIRLNGEGVRLWTRGGAVVPFWPGWEVSYDFRLENNLIESNGTGFSGYTGAETITQECHDYNLRGNVFHDNRIGAYFNRVQGCRLEANTFRANIEAAVRLVSSPGVTLNANQFEGNRANVLNVHK